MGRHSRPKTHRFAVPVAAVRGTVLRGGPLAVAVVALTGAAYAQGDAMPVAGLLGASSSPQPSVAAGAVPRVDVREPLPDPRPPHAEPRAASRSHTRAKPKDPAPVTVAVAGCSGHVGTHYANGRLPASALCRVPGTDALLRADAARALAALNDAARKALGAPLCIGGGYRSYAAQAALHAQKPGLAAPAGTSNHGNGTAVDMCGSAASEGTTAHEWMERVGPRFGWVLPSWAHPGGSRPEPWHFEYVG